jgi:hypothetical protein
LHSHKTVLPFNCVALVHSSACSLKKGIRAGEWLKAKRSMLKPEVLAKAGLPRGACGEGGG